MVVYALHGCLPRASAGHKYLNLPDLPIQAYFHLKLTTKTLAPAECLVRGTDQPSFVDMCWVGPNYTFE